ncbi:MAG: cobalamin-binding protein [Thaumarchaeota archaeon]|nr:cobalamin-binding protein [Nitrososphaerota archaeon]
MAFKRIVSLLPTATEILFALGVGDNIVAVTHECDYPPEANSKTKILSTRIDPNKSSREIDSQVASMHAGGQSIYEIDGELLDSLQPDLIITQTQCKVCAVYFDEVKQTVEEMSSFARVVPLEANSTDDILSNIIHVGKLVGAEERAKKLVDGITKRIEQVRSATRRMPKVATCFIEWLDPIYLGGHWVPEMIEIAGGLQPIQQKWAPSIPRRWEQVLEARPEVLIIAPCSYKLDKTLRELPHLERSEGWENIPAVKNGRVFVADEGYFTRSGPRFIDGLEILASAIRPEIFGEGFMADKEILRVSRLAHQANWNFNKVS